MASGSGIKGVDLVADVMQEEMKSSRNHMKRCFARYLKVDSWFFWGPGLVPKFLIFVCLFVCVVRVKWKFMKFTRFFDLLLGW